jgi:putative ABC transport system permease protein
MSPQEVRDPASARGGLSLSDRWFRLLLRLYPADFRDEMGQAVVEAYGERARQAAGRGGIGPLAAVWLAALVDSFRNGLGERLRPTVSWRRTGDWGRDLERVRRRLFRKPMFVLATVGTLTVGLGTFAVVYTAVDKILLEPLPFRDPDDLYMVWANSPGLEHLMVTGPDVAELQAAADVIEDAAAFQFGTPTLPPNDDADAQRIDAVAASANLFDLLGVGPASGRVFGPDDGRSDAAPVVVLSDGLWRRLGAQPSVVGSTLRLSTVPYTVIGVMPPQFEFAGNSSLVKPDAYIPYRINLATQGATDSNFRAVIRARRGTPPAQVRQAVDRVGSYVGRRDFKRDNRTLFAIGLHEELVEAERPALLSLAFTTIFLILALTVNLASLLLARAAEREREFAISRALGASGAAVARATLFEGTLLGLLGGVAAALAGIWGTRALVALGPPTLARRETIALDPGIAAVVVAVGLFLGVIAAALPALWVARVSMISLSSSFVRGTAGSGRMRRSLVVAQVALSLVLLSAGALVARSFERLLTADPGFQPGGVLTLGIGISGGGIFGQDANAYAFLDQLDAAVGALSGVTAVSATTQLPLSGGGNVVGVNLPGASDAVETIGPTGGVVSRIFIRGGYVKAMGLRLREGREPRPSPGADAREALIDQVLARYVFPNGGAVGATLMSGGRPLTIVGVVDQPRLFDLHQDDRTPQIFVRAEDFPGRRPGTYVVRTRDDPYTLIPHIRRAVRQVDARVPLSSIQTMDQLVSAKRSEERMSTVLIGGLALGALLFAAMGLFGVISGTVTKRREELAVRLALGATHGRVLRLIMGEGVVLVALGVLLGVPGVYAAGNLVRGLLIDISPWDPPTLVGVALGLAVVAMAACYAPARRVLRIEPAPLLRQE